MNRKTHLRRWAVVLFCLCCLWGGWFLFQPRLFLCGNGESIASVPAVPHTPFSIHFIHSVQKTPVEENLVLDEDGKTFLLVSTRYQSFGVGLPFLATEGDFRQEDNFYILDHIQRRFSELSLRTGVGTQLTVDLGGEVYRLYESYPPGTKIDIFTASRFDKIVKDLKNQQQR